MSTQSRTRARPQRSLLLAASLIACLYAGFAANGARAGIAEPPAQIEPPAAPAQADPPAAPPQAEPPAASTDPGSTQVGSTDQSASSDASATQQQPINIVVSVRIDSPGDEGPISQRNVVASVSGSSNSASTTQGGGSSAAAGPGQDASTDQQAGSSATATQDGAQNIVISVRVGSPGDSGPVSQTNVSVGVSNATNGSDTTQGGAPDTTSTAPAPVAQPASQGQAGSRAPKRRPASGTKKRHESPAAAAPAAPAPAAGYGTTASPPTAAAPAARQAIRAPAPRPHAARPSAARVASTVPQRIAGRAGDLLGTLAAPTTVAGSGSTPDVSGSVLLSLLAVLAAVAAFLAWPQLCRALRLAGPRIRPRG